MQDSVILQHVAAAIAGHKCVRNKMWWEAHIIQASCGDTIWVVPPRACAYPPAWCTWIMRNAVFLYGALATCTFSQPHFSWGPIEPFIHVILT